GLTRQVNAPGAVLATRLALAMTDPSAHVGDLVSVPFEGLCNVCLADRHVAFGGVHSIEEVGDITATQVWLHGLEPNDFRRYPIRLAARAVMGGFLGRIIAPAAAETATIRLTKPQPRVNTDNRSQQIRHH